MAESMPTTGEQRGWATRKDDWSSIAVGLERGAGARPCLPTTLDPLRRGTLTERADGS